MKQNHEENNEAMAIDGARRSKQDVEGHRKDRFEVMLWVMYVCYLPDDPWVGPTTDSAVQPHTLLLPHGVGAWLNHKLRGVHQAVFVHTLKMFLVFMDLQTEQYLSIKTFSTVTSLKLFFF